MVPLNLFLQFEHIHIYQDTHTCIEPIIRNDLEEVYSWVTIRTTHEYISYSSDKIYHYVKQSLPEVQR